MEQKVENKKVEGGQRPNAIIGKEPLLDEKDRADSPEKILERMRYIESVAWNAYHLERIAKSSNFKDERFAALEKLSDNPSFLGDVARWTEYEDVGIAAVNKLKGMEDQLKLTVHGARRENIARAAIGVSDTTTLMELIRGGEGGQFWIEKRKIIGRKIIELAKQGEAGDGALRCVAVYVEDYEVGMEAAKMISKNNDAMMDIALNSRNYSVAKFALQKPYSEDELRYNSKYARDWDIRNLAKERLPSIFDRIMRALFD